MSENDTTRVNPVIERQVVNDLKAAIRAFNDGKVKGRFSPALSEAMQLYTACLFATNPDKLRNIEHILDIDDVKEIDDPDAYRERVIDMVDSVSGTLNQAAHQVHREGPGEPTRLEEYVRMKPSSSSTDDEDRRETTELKSPLLRSGN